MMNGEIRVHVRLYHASSVQELIFYSKSNGQMKVSKQVSDIYQFKIYS